jgi:hypothetical protein
MIENALIWDCHFQEIPRQDWPDTPGAVFVTKGNGSAEDLPWHVSTWVDDPIENVLGLGRFWKKEDAVLFAIARANLNSPVKTAAKDGE